MKSSLYIRADAHTVIGTGHVMRCLALAEAWQRKAGGPVTFLGRIDAAGLAERIRREGFSYIQMPAVHPDPADAGLVADVLAKDPEKAASWLVLDGYHLDADYQATLRQGGTRLLVVDDTAHLPAYHGDILLNPNLYAAGLRYPAGSGMLRLLGPRYALLRDEFRREKGRRPDSPPIARRILVTLGGADPENATARILACLAGLRIPGLEVKALVGAANPHGADLARLVERLAISCTLIPSASDMASLMHWADAAIAAAGSTIYELAACGVPFAAVVIADNQEQNAHEMGAQGVAIHLGRLDTLSESRLAAYLYGFIHDRQRRRDQIRTGRNLVDGRGPGRVVEAMCGEALVLRPVRWEDRDLLLEWANDPETRRNSFHSGQIGPEEHAKWLAARLGDDGCRMYIAMEHRDRPIGVVRFDAAGTSAVISVNLARTARGKGLGSRVIAAACQRLATEAPAVRIEARVKEGNAASRRAFENAGFVPAGRTVQNHIPALTLAFCANQDDC